MSMNPGPGGNVLPELPPLQALWRGIVTGLVLVLPAAILNQYLLDEGTIEPGHPATFMFWILILLGGAAAGWATIRLAPSAQLWHAAVAGAGAYGVAQGLGVVLRLLSDEPISWLAYPFMAIMMATCGTLGGMFARKWMQQNGPAPRDQG
jgi:hypothetical protein